MARLSLQIKNVASLLLAAAASVAWSIASRRLFDTPTRPWIPFALAGALFLTCQLGLIFVESKEEEELSLSRRQRMARIQQASLEQEKLSERTQHEIDVGSVAVAAEWSAYREIHHGK